MKKKKWIIIIIIAVLVISIAIFVMSLGIRSVTFLKHVRDQNITQVRQILEKQPTLANVTFKNNVTPLHIAAVNGDVETVKLLLRYGANVNAATKSGNVPLDFAILECRKSLKNEKEKESLFNQRKEIIKLLVVNGTKLNRPEKIAAALKTENIGEELLLIISFGDKELVELFLEHGASVNIFHQKAAQFSKNKEIEKLISDYIK